MEICESRQVRLQQKVVHVFFMQIFRLLCGATCGTIQVCFFFFIWPLLSHLIYFIGAIKQIWTFKRSNSLILAAWLYWQFLFFLFLFFYKDPMHFTYRKVEACTYLLQIQSFLLHFKQFHRLICIHTHMDLMHEFTQHACIYFKHKTPSGSMQVPPACINI